jgi:hypothetical protein
MSRTSTLDSILGSLPLSKRLLAPLRQVREKEWGEPLPAVEYPVQAFASELLPRPEAWELFRELRNDERLKEVAVVVAPGDADVLGAYWEDACPAAEKLLAMQSSSTPLPVTESSERVRRWLESAAGQRSLAKAARMKVRASTPSSVEWMTSIRQPYAPEHERQAVYVIDVDPWAAPLALTWLLTPDRWDAVVTTLRTWRAEHGFTVVALTADVLEAWVERPPATAAELAARLGESEAFSSGYLDEGYAPRAEMLRGHVWQFRFDI